MLTLDANQNSAKIEMSFEELKMLHETLSIVLKDIEEWEYSIRIGVKKSEGTLLNSELSCAIDSFNSDSQHQKNA